jgi:hypothetical protein
LYRVDNDSEIVDEAISNQHAHVLVSAGDVRTNNPDVVTDLNGAKTTYLVRPVTTEQGTKERATGHGSFDFTLYGGFRTGNLFSFRAQQRTPRSLVETASVLLGWQAVV